MYAGHAGLALYGKTFRPRVPMAVLVPVAYAPDWIQWLLTAAGGPHNPSISHSIVSVIIGATIAAGIYWGVSKSAADAAIVGLTYLSHWPADFITGSKAIWPNGPEVGLNLYQHVAADVIVESIVVVLCWLAYRRSLPEASKAKLLDWAIPVGLIAFQIGFVLIQYPAIHDPIRQILTN